MQNLRIGGNASYDSPEIFNNLLAALNQLLENQVDVKVRASPCIGVRIDEVPTGLMRNTSLSSFDILNLLQQNLLQHF